MGRAGHRFHRRGAGPQDRGGGRRREALRRYLDDPLEVLRRLGGREVAAMAGAILAARMQRVPVVLDGYVVTAAAAVLHALNPAAIDHCLAGHVSAEPAHRRVLEKLGLAPILDLGMRLGEGSGAALSIGVIKAALACHSGDGDVCRGGGGVGGVALREHPSRLAGARTSG